MGCRGCQRRRRGIKLVSNSLVLEAAAAPDRALAKKYQREDPTTRRICICKNASSGLAAPAEDSTFRAAGASRIESSYIVGLRDLDMKHVKDFIFIHISHMWMTLKFSSTSSWRIKLMGVDALFFNRECSQKLSYEDYY
ncbi:uncharacterized protein LOC130996887 [Salvia miltiorrhiza]|uniref:uncharacterized protein LOC130996887 n=1 Tax=Salvia miltiorrhiza TaxID=226208 RepID=UPI0025AD136B|nr:uncharacterized protein LOC130996887 [Salvia miltiorrhiza]